MSDIRNLLDIAAEYTMQKDSTDTYPDSISEQKAEARLDEIALRFKTALDAVISSP